MERDLTKHKKRLFDSLRRNIRSETVIKAMAQVPRELFVPPESRDKAYLNLPLGIGEGQTISQPYIVAIMLEALGLRGNERVLEIGAGSGYQAAVLSLLVPQGRVVTVELIPSLALRAKKLLEALGHTNVAVAQAGPQLGCPSLGPFDAIIVAAASPRLPDSLISQLAVGGRMIIPVGTLERQELVYAVRTGEGLSVRMMGSCRFVPLIDREAFPKAQ